MFFVSLKGAGAHSSYLAGPHLWMAPDFESWRALALGNAEVFSAQRKIPKVYRAQICREKKKYPNQNRAFGMSRRPGRDEATDVWFLLRQTVEGD